MKKALEFLMDVADTKPDHKALGRKERFAGTVAGNGTSNEYICLKKFVTGRSEVGTIKIKHLGKI